MDPVAGELDDVDVRIIAALQQDGRRAFTEIARDLAVSEGTVRQRVGRLQRRGIVQIVAVVKPENLGLRRLLIGVEVRGRAVSQVEGVIRDFAEIDYVAYCAGTPELVLMAACRDDDHVLELVSERLRQIPGVAGLQVTSILRETKDAYQYTAPRSGG